MVRKAKEVRAAHPVLAAWVDWLGVLVATTSFVFVALWASAPDSAFLTIEQALYRALTYGVPITAGMWGITRATRKGSAVPRRMSEAMPYARIGSDGKPYGGTSLDDKNGVAPTPLGKSDGSQVQ